MIMTTLQTRVMNKHDTEANWEILGDSFTPFAGEIIIYDPDEDYTYPRIKIGDGEKNIS